MGTSGVAETVARTVRDAIEATGRSVHGLAVETGIPYTTLDRKLRRGTFTVEELYLLGIALDREPASFFPPRDEAA